MPTYTLTTQAPGELELVRHGDWTSAGATQWARERGGELPPGTTIRVRRDGTVARIYRVGEGTVTPSADYTQSGPNIPAAQRKRPAHLVTLSPAAWDEVRRRGPTVSGALEAAVWATVAPNSDVE